MLGGCCVLAKSRSDPTQGASQCLRALRTGGGSDGRPLGGLRESRTPAPDGAQKKRQRLPH